MAFIGGVIIGGIIMLFVMFAVVGSNNKEWQLNCVKSGKAEFYLDSNHNKQWRFLP